MTCLIDLIEQGSVTPDEHGSKHVWWAYIHSGDAKVKVKKWLPATTLMKVDDREYAEKEQTQGNHNILLVLEKPFCCTPDLKVERAWELIRKQLKRDKLRVRCDPARSPHFYLERFTKVKPYHRFRDIELD